MDTDRETYIPKYRRVRTSNFKLVKQTEAARSFFERYSGNKIFSIAKRGQSSVRSPGRHYSYYIDVERLFNHPAFLYELEKCVRENGQIDCLVFLDIEMNNVFCELILNIHHRVFGSEVFEVKKLKRFEDIPVEDSLVKVLTTPEKHVMFADGMVVTGSNLRDLSQTIRRLNGQGAPCTAKLTYLVGMYRPYSHQKVKWVKYFEQASVHYGFKGTTHFKAVEKVVLPLWSTDECP